MVTKRIAYRFSDRARENYDIGVVRLSDRRLSDSRDRPRMTACTRGRPMACTSRSSPAETASMASTQLTLTASTRSDSRGLLRSIRNGGSAERRSRRCSRRAAAAKHVVMPG